MNLLKKFLPNSSCHIDSMAFDASNQQFVIKFYHIANSENQPPEAYLTLTFGNVDKFCYEQIDQEDEPYIDMAIGFDLTPDGYLLHTTLAEIVFTATSISAEIFNSQTDV